MQREEVIEELDTEIGTQEASLNEDCEAEAEEPTEAEEGNAVGKKDEKSDTPPVDYERLAEEDAAELRTLFPELDTLKSITELENPLRYAALRDLGLTPEEAYLATTRRKRADNRSHLNASVPRHSSTPSSSMSEAELAAARELFPDISDAKIRSLYKKVTK